MLPRVLTFKILFRTGVVSRTVLGQSFEVNTLRMVVISSMWRSWLRPRKWLKERMTTSLGWASSHSLISIRTVCQRHRKKKKSQPYVKSLQHAHPKLVTLPDVIMRLDWCLAITHGNLHKLIWPVVAHMLQLCRRMQLIETDCIHHKSRLKYFYSYSNLVHDCHYIVINTCPMEAK